ncbi:hypothetical protein O6H91_06G090600 [Diphasiastrum complanatum]|uniref:Uncharacterized protein n=1 Tax=Diphasiastrum complanatum TaxID=34168 RepID=A0ACC2DG50_DIPCM|nr:hypothetical protein O6H91_06G090600 [Diphasiastrum complanatum]
MSSAQGFWPIGWLKKWIDYNSNNACDASKKEEDGIGAEENEDVNEVAAAGECVATVSANVTRATDPRYAVGHQTAFADVFPMQLISQASVDKVNEKTSEPLHVDRFRPNIVVDGTEAFAEDYWRTFKIGRLKFHGVALCPRCKQTTIDQGTGEMGPEPLSALRTFRAGRFLTSEPKVKNMVYFGQYLVCDPSQKGVKAVIEVGNQIRLQEKAPPAFFYLQSA